MKRSRELPGHYVRSKRSRETRESESARRNSNTVSMSDIIKQRVDRAIKKTLNNEDDLFRTRLQNTEKLVPDFDPENRDLNIRSFINKIEQLGVIYRWNDETKSFILQSKLQGQARLWFNRLDSYDYSWEDWKNMIMKAFPRHHDFATLLDELMARNKLPNESMTKYFQEKLAMCFRCQLSDQAAVSCIIRGLPQELQANAQAFQCSAPDELYEGFLSAFDSYQANSHKSQYSKVTRINEASTSQLPKDTNPRKPPICYRCNEVGHVATTCKLPDKRKCFRCGKVGHVATTCSAVDENQAVVKKVQLLSHLNEAYKKTVRVNGVYMKAYLDTGSEVNVIYTGAVDAIKLKASPSNTVLKGFNDCSVRAIGEVNFELLVDNLPIKTTAIVTDVDLGDVVLIIGQTVINREDIILSVSKNGVQLSKVLETPNDLVNIDVCDEASCFRVELIEDTIVPVGDNLVRVAVQGAGPGDYCSKPRQYSMGNVVYAVASTVLRSGNGYVRVCNIGAGPIAWKKGMVVARAEKCTPNIEVSSNFLTLSRGEYVSNDFDHELANINVGDIGPDYMCNLIELLKLHRDCFASTNQEIGCTNLGEMSIELNSDKPVVRKPYRLAHTERKVVSNIIDDLISGGIVRESNSQYASPIILVRKKNGDYRLCVDYRDLNAVTIKDRFPLPHIDDQLSKLSDKHYFTNLDLFSGYHHIKIHPDSINKTAFVTPDGLYEYLRVPFGLANAPSVFMRVIQKLVKLVGSDEIITFMDDMLLSTSNVSSGLELLQRVLVQLRKADLKLNIKKCAFLKSEVSFLGHEISAGGIRPGNHKIEAVSNFPKPVNLHQLRQFLGLCSYFRKYINKFALIAKPLTDLTKKSSEWIWLDKHDSCFNELKQKLCSRPVLALYNPSLPCEIHTDASKLGIAGILFQLQYNNELKPVFYFSRVTSREESMYHSYELETLAVVESLKHFRVYVYGHSVKIVTDCSAVRYTLLKKDIVPRIARWWFTIQEYDIQIEYRPGYRMKHVDALSRNPTKSAENNVDLEQFTCKIINVHMISSDDWYLTIQLQDDKLNNIIKQLSEGNACEDIKNNYKIKNDRLYKITLNGDRLVVPSFARWKFMQKFHDQIGHIGIKRCEELIKSDYWFPKMTRFIKKYVSSCLECAYAKGNHGKPSGELHPIPKPSVPMEVVHIDHLGPFSKTKKGYQYILMIVDSFSKFLLARPTRTINSVETVTVLKDVFSLFGYPKKIISDRNLAFTSRVFKEFATQYQFQHTLNAIACPRANGQVERYNRTLLDAMRTRNVDPNMWTECIPDSVWGMNNTVNESLGYHPYEIMFSHKGRLMPNLVGNDMCVSVGEKRQNASKRLEHRAQIMKRNYDRRHKPEKIFKKGDLVLWKQAPSGGEVKSVNNKLQVLYSGPYIVQKVLNNGRYEIRSVKGMRGYKKFSGIVAADSLRAYRSAPDCSETSSDEDVVTRDDLIDLLES